MGLLVGGQGCRSRSRPVMEEADPGACLPELVPDEPPRARVDGRQACWDSTASSDCFTSRGRRILGREM